MREGRVDMTERFTTLEKTHFDHADLFRISVSNYAQLNVYGVHVSVDSFCQFFLPLNVTRVLSMLAFYASNSIKYIFLF